MVLLGLGMAQGRAFAASPPSGAQLEKPAYASLVAADRAADAGQVEPARTRYAEALERFRELQQKFPAFKKESVEFRIRYCRTRLDELKRDPAAAAAPAPAKPAVGAAVGPAPEAAPKPAEAMPAATEPAPQAETTRAQPAKAADAEGAALLAALRAQVSQLQSERSDLEKRLNDVNGQYLALARSSAGGTAVAAELRANTKQADAARLKAEAERDRQVQELNRVNGEYLRLAQSSATAAAELAALKDQLKDAQRLIDARDRENLELKRAIGRGTAAPAEAAPGAAAPASADAARQAEQLRTELIKAENLRTETVRSWQAELDRQAGFAAAEKDSLLKVQQAHEEQIAALTQDLEAARRASAEALQQKVAAAKEAAEAKRAGEPARRETERLNARIAALDLGNAALRSKVADAMAKIDQTADAVRLSEEQARKLQKAASDHAALQDQLRVQAFDLKSVRDEIKDLTRTKEALEKEITQLNARLAEATKPQNP